MRIKWCAHSNERMINYRAYNKSTLHNYTTLSLIWLTNCTLSKETAISPTVCRCLKKYSRFDLYTVPFLCLVQRFTFRWHVTPMLLFSIRRSFDEYGNCDTRNENNAEICVLGTETRSRLNRDFLFSLDAPKDSSELEPSFNSICHAYQKLSARCCGWHARNRARKLFTSRCKGNLLRRTLLFKFPRKFHRERTISRSFDLFSVTFALQKAIQTVIRTTIVY